MKALAYALLPLLLATACDATEGNVLSTFDDDGPTATTATTTDDSGDGDGDGDACAADGPCPAPDAGLVTVCGRVYDLETTEPLSGEFGQPGAALVVRIFDQASFSSDPTATALATTRADECGWYVADNIEDVPAGPIVVSTNDLSFPGLGFQPVHSVHDSAPGQIVRANAWALPFQTDANWASDAGVGGTFATIGSLLAIFIDTNGEATGPFPGQPVAGVTVTADGVPNTDNDFYFSDPGALDRVSVSPDQTSTGPDGAAIFRDFELTNDYSGTRLGCAFETHSGLTAPGVIEVHEFLGTCAP